MVISPHRSCVNFQPIIKDRTNNLFVAIGFDKYGVAVTQGLQLLFLHSW